MSFLRMQEYYESPRFRGQVFGLEEFMDWYSPNYGDGAFTYPKDWTGFNVPADAVRALRDRFSDHSRKEAALLAGLEAAGVLADERFYLIGTSRDNDADTDERADDTVLAHEIRHGLFYCSDAYREEVTAVIQRHDLQRWRKKLAAMGYDEAVFVDETQAYVLTGWPRGWRPTAEMRRLQDELRSVETRFLP